MSLPEFEFHELANLFPLIEGTAFDELAADIASHGVREPVVLFEGKILDGRNRYRAAHQSGTRFATTDYSGPDARAFVMSMNLHRRHLTAEQKRALIQSELKADPAQSDRSIAAKVKVGDKTVTVQRKALEAGAEIPHVPKKAGRDGKVYAAKPKPTPPKPLSAGPCGPGARNVVVVDGVEVLDPRSAQASKGALPERGVRRRNPKLPPPTYPCASLVTPADFEARRVVTWLDALNPADLTDAPLIILQLKAQVGDLTSEGDSTWLDRVFEERDRLRKQIKGHVLKLAGKSNDRFVSEVDSIIEKLTEQGKANVATFSPSAVSLCAVKLQALLQSMVEVSP